MFKLFRAVKSEHRKLWCKRSPFLWVIAVAALAACIFGASDKYLTDGGDWFLSNRFTAMLAERSSDGEAYTADGHKQTVSVPSANNSVSRSDEVLSWSDVTVPIIAEIGWRAKESKKANAASEKWYSLESELVEGTPESYGIMREQAAAERVVLTSEYRLKNDIEPQDNRVWILIQMTVWMVMPIAAAVAAAAASDMFAGEYTRGTIVMNLARPITRIKQYTAKLITAEFYGALLMIAAFLGALITGFVRCGAENDVYIGYVNGEVYQTTCMKQSLMVLGCCYASVVICIAICAALGTLTRSRTASAMGAAVLTAVGVYFGRAIAPTIKLVSGISVLSCLDLTAPLVECANLPTLSFADCAVSLVIHYFIITVSGYFFMKKDIYE